MRRGVIWAVGLVLTLAVSSAAQTQTRRVLIVTSFDSGFASDAAFIRAFRTELSRQSLEPINFFEASLQPTPSGEAINEEAVADYLRGSLSGQRLDLIVTTSAPAALFARKYRARLFPETPILLASVEQRWLQGEILAASEAAVPFAIDPVRNVEDILRLLPQTAHLFVVLGDSRLERFWLDELRRNFQPLTDRLTVTWFNGLSFAEMLKHVAALPEHSAIFYVLLSVDANGFSHSEERVLTELHAVANAPMFSLFSNQLGSGVVGGPMLSVDRLARRSASTAVGLLRGDAAAAVKAEPPAAGPPIYDWRELRRWGIDDARLPPASIVLFRQPDVWDQYQAYIVAAVLIVALQSVLLAGLVVQGARRRRTELALRESEQRFRLTAEQNQDLAGRLINAQEQERGRIARDLHDDLSQQLAGLAIMLSGLKRTLSQPDGQSRVDDTVETLQNRTQTIASVVRNLSHQLHPGALDHVGLVGTLTQHCAEIERHHGIAVTFMARGDLESLDRDVALCLYRVTQEALTNALRHACARNVLVELTAAADIELRVADDGVGFVADGSAGTGLGLRSIDERVRLVHGRVRIDSRPGHGTALMVYIPLTAARHHVAQPAQADRTPRAEINRDHGPL
jgi:signal transduction histidine kinase